MKNWLLAAGTGGLTRWFWIVIIGALVAFVFLGKAIVSDWLDDTVEVSKEAGASGQREADLSETLNRTEKANEAAAEVERDDNARRAGCLRHSRTPENC